MNIKRMDLAWITSNDLEKSKTFFSETLGLKITVESTQYGWLELTGNQGGATLGIGQCNEYTPIKAGQNAILTMTVDNIIDAKKELEEKQVKIIGDITEVPGEVKMLLFQDPDGNYFQLCEILKK